MAKESDLLKATVAAASILINGGNRMKDLRRTIERQRAAERALDAASLSGSTEPDDET
jgi:hypothetical protein